VSRASRERKFRHEALRVFAALPKSASVTRGID
jgi:hypothetical protein